MAFVAVAVAVAVAAAAAAAAAAAVAVAVLLLLLLSLLLLLLLLLLVELLQPCWCCRRFALGLCKLRTFQGVRCVVLVKFEFPFII